jgi:hypothetical protein
MNGSPDESVQDESNDLLCEMEESDEAKDHSEKAARTPPRTFWLCFHVFSAVLLWNDVYGTGFLGWPVNCKACPVAELSVQRSISVRAGGLEG